jgi:hypothetical protein
VRKFQGSEGTRRGEIYMMLVEEKGVDFFVEGMAKFQDSHDN